MSGGKAYKPRIRYQMFGFPADTDMTDWFVHRLYPQVAYQMATSRLVLREFLLANVFSHDQKSRYPGQRAVGSGFSYAIKNPRGGRLPYESDPYRDPHLYQAGTYNAYTKKWTFKGGKHMCAYVNGVIIHQTRNVNCHDDKHLHGAAPFPNTQHARSIDMRGDSTDKSLGSFNYSLIDIEVERDGKGGLIWSGRLLVTDTPGISKGDCNPLAIQHANKKENGGKDVRQGASAIPNIIWRLSPWDVYEFPSIIIAEWEMEGRIDAATIRKRGGFAPAPLPNPLVVKRCNRVEYIEFPLPWE